MKLTLIIAVGSFPGSIFRTAVSAMIWDEIRTRLGMLPGLLVEMAASWLPRDARDDATSERQAEYDLRHFTPVR